MSKKTRRLSSEVAQTEPTEREKFERMMDENTADDVATIDADALEPSGTPVGQDDEHPSDADEQSVADALDEAASADSPDSAEGTLVEETDTAELPSEDASETASESPTPSADAPDPTPSAAPPEGSTASPSASTDAPKASADPRANTVGSRTARYQLTDRIVILVRNPKRPGTAGRARYECYADGQTVSSYLEDERVGNFGRTDISWDLARGHIAIVPEAEVPDVIKSRSVYWAKEDAKRAAAAATAAAKTAKAAPTTESSK